MFLNIISALVIASAIIAGNFVGASLLPQELELAVRTAPSCSFNHWGGISSLDNFDSFYGSNNFDNSKFSSRNIVVKQTTNLVCHREDIKIIQQRLLVIQELVKRVLTEQICEVETQTIVFQQFYASLRGFSHDLRRSSGRPVGFDSAIAFHSSSIVQADGSLSVDDFGFSGLDLGKSYVVPEGNNWFNSRSFISVGNAYITARSATNGF